MHEDAKIPQRAHGTDYGYDVTAVSVEKVGFLTYKYHLGFAIEPVRDKQRFGNLCVRIAPRSSVWKTGMVLSNCEGIIDESYRGEVCAVYYHVLPWKKKYKAGDRVGQMFIATAPKMTFIEADTLSVTERADGGYGSSGR